MGVTSQAHGAPVPPVSQVLRAVAPRPVSYLVQEQQGFLGSASVIRPACD